RVGLEADYVPFLSESQQVVGFNGTKAEDLNHLPVLIRPVLTLGLPFKLALTASYLPPIPVGGVQAHLFSASVARPFPLGEFFKLGAAIYGQVGTVTGAFTCPDSAVRAGSDPALNPFGCLTISGDWAYLDYLGAQASASYRIQALGNLE